MIFKIKNLQLIILSIFIACSEKEGCADQYACNFDSSVDVDDGISCAYAEQYYDCNGGCLNDDDNDGICNELEVLGCMDESACNYNESATDNSECTYSQEYYDCNGECIIDDDDDGICNQLEVVGCMDESACNYNELANENGECTYAQEYYDCNGGCH